MTEVMLAIVILVFFANLLLDCPLIDSLLFSLALAVGLTPELLPAIISVALARGARTMATGGVIVRRLDAIENLGSMDLLCTDKTGTLTEGVIRLDACTDPHGADSEQTPCDTRTAWPCDRQDHARISQERPGMMLSLSRQTVNGLLKELESEQLISCVRGGLRILDLEGLAALEAS